MFTLMSITSIWSSVFSFLSLLSCVHIFSSCSLLLDSHARGTAVHNLPSLVLSQGLWSSTHLIFPLPLSRMSFSSHSHYLSYTSTTNNHYPQPSKRLQSSRVRVSLSCRQRCIVSSSAYMCIYLTLYQTIELFLILQPPQHIPMWPTDWYVDRHFILMNNHDDFYFCLVGLSDMDLY